MIIFRRVIGVRFSSTCEAKIESQHTRWRGWAQSCLLALALCLALAGMASPARAQEAYPGGYTLMPLNPGSIQLLSMTVDASIRSNGEGQALADVQAVFRVHNRDLGQTQTLSFAFPGYAVDEPLPDSWSVRAAGREITYSGAQTQWWVAETTIEADERVNLVLTYTVPLGDTAFVRFRYPLDLTAQFWPGTLESARVTLSFNEPPNPQSWLQLTPETYKLTAESITWSYDAADPAQPIDYWLMHPALWEQLRSARLTAAAEQTATAYLALGDIYARLTAGAADSAIFERYFPLTVAAYGQAQTAEPQNPNTYLALARIYRQRAELTQPPDATFVSLAVNQLAGALEHGAQDPAIAEAVVNDFTTLVARARAEGDFDTANTYLERLETLAERSQIPLQSDTLAAERRQLAIDWASTILRDQGPGPARQVLEDMFGAGIAQPQAANFARLNSLHVIVGSIPGQRNIQILAAPRSGDNGMLLGLRDALAATTVASVTLDQAQPPVLFLELPFSDAADLRQKLQTLAAAVPAEAEWTLLADALSPQNLSWQRTDEGWRVKETFSEDVALVASAAAIAVQAQALDQAAAAAVAADPLDALLAKVWRAEAEVWRRLAANSSARFTLTLDPTPGAPVIRTWSLDPGEQARMSGRVTHYQVGPYTLAGLGVYLSFMVVTFLIWRRGE